MTFIKGSSRVAYRAPADCTICTKPMAKKQSLLELKCGHIFHEKCALSHLADQMKSHEHRKCQQCGQKVEVMADAIPKAKEMIRTHERKDFAMLNDAELQNLQAAYAFCDTEKEKEFTDSIKQNKCLLNICIIGFGIIGTMLLAGHAILKSE